MEICDFGAWSENVWKQLNMKEICDLGDRPKKLMKNLSNINENPWFLGKALKPVKTYRISMETSDLDAWQTQMRICVLGAWPYKLWKTYQISMEMRGLKAWL